MEQPEDLYTHSRHSVILYGEDDARLLAILKRDVSEAVAAGRGAILIVTEPHVAPLAQAFPPDGEGRVVVWDARELLGQFMQDSMPDASRFKFSVVSKIRSMTDKFGSVYAYGEMVGLLWEDGNPAAAAQLERLWNSILRPGVRLVCGYPLDTNDPAFTIPAVDEIMCAHDDLRPLREPLRYRHALHESMEDVLGERFDELKHTIRPNYRPKWGMLPEPEATVLWLRNNLPGTGDEIVRRAAEYFED